MQENLKSHKAQVCDSRGPDMFNHSPNGIILYHTIRFSSQRNISEIINLVCIYTSKL